MSFTETVINELLSAKTQKTCCRKAELLGLLLGAVCIGDNRIKAEFKSAEVAALAAEIIRKQFSAEPELFEVRRAGRVFYSLSASTKAITLFLSKLDKGEQTELSALVGFRCEECAHAFFRGAFMALGSVNDPQKSYHLELSLPNEKRADALAAFLKHQGIEAKRIVRGTKFGLYYKKNANIVDILYYMGATQSGFGMSDICIEADIRNGENRATNCVTTNIARAVEVSIRHIEAIEMLGDAGKLQKLSEELRYTAELRCENPGASLSELAMMHQPPISKSGLNRRLCKLMEEAEALRKKENK